MIAFLKKYLPENIWFAVSEYTHERENDIQEIRLRIHKPIQIKTNTSIWMPKECVLTSKEMAEIIAKISQYSLYAFTEELGQGYMTLAGGHRVGFCGKAIFQNGKITSLRQISSINIRIAKEVKGCGEKWIPYLFEKDKLCHTLLISPPGCGKTTLLRDIIRLLSDGWEGLGGYTTGIVDERGEIAAVEDGIPQLDVGSCSDVQCGCPKSDGMQFLLRSMGPEIIAVDELGSEMDFAAVNALLHAGVVVIATIHGSDYESLEKNGMAKKMLSDMTYGRILILSKENGVGTVSEIRTHSGICLYKRRGSI